MQAKTSSGQVDKAAERLRFHVVVSLISGMLSVMSFVSGAQADIVFYNNRGNFMTDSRVTTTTAINFDSFSTGINLDDQSVSGVTFRAPDLTSLSIIEGVTGVRNPMTPSSGANILSPGGSNPDLQSDSLELLFATPVSAVGLDVIFDVPDGASYVGVVFYDSLNNALHSTGFIEAPSGAPGYQFTGLVADSAIISRVVFNEYDNSPSDDHVAYDSIVFSPAVVPEPSLFLLIASGIAGISFAKGRRSGRKFE